MTPKEQKETLQKIYTAGFTAALHKLAHHLSSVGLQEMKRMCDEAFEEFYNKFFEGKIK